VSTAWVVTGTALVVFGFLIYYLLPLALLTFNLALFFNIFFGILLGVRVSSVCVLVCVCVCGCVCVVCAVGTVASNLFLRAISLSDGVFVPITTVLLQLLFGLILLSLNLEHMVEKLVAFVFLWWEHRSVRGMTLKNLVCSHSCLLELMDDMADSICDSPVHNVVCTYKQVAHRMRNRKTTIMYALSLGFIIFITVSSPLGQAVHPVAVDADTFNDID